MDETDFQEPQIELAIIDCDSICYRAAAGAGDDSPVEHALHNAKGMIDKIFDFLDPETYTIYLGGEGNFRFDVATIRPYKGNRNQPKPVHLQAVREYIANNWGAAFVDGIEADDACATEHTKALTDNIVSCIVSIDKDMQQLYGWHFNFVKERLFWVDELTAKRNFWYQMLVGDTSDNIQGVKDIGPKKATRILDMCPDEMSMIEAVRKEYQKCYGDSWLESMTENGRLLHLRRFEGEVWQCPI